MNSKKRDLDKIIKICPICKKEYETQTLTRNPLNNEIKFMCVECFICVSNQLDEYEDIDGEILVKFWKINKI